ncbi:MAG: DUF58 domain-containing protein [Dehalococcoidia bacterium]|uniref:DUF58 domain-containing protein n=1 Tax=Candidatus Amarobacter glycogenicus TaxID=3140699 RepID=UPI0031360B51|nr:DUF58 domain-containing protein [Dehalococcoidia bacterium]MBK6562215.1 DUF58 domain-containing protein [Dehalococcoidia bacterium]MBK7124589.1 DUF58 domain-containing protein [Dehalococcoidia bacterium]MBK7328056.1 DUF58 domain-containing protein [Dehalococcoidia bacterium]MBK8561286.1 DUF58 domain-containing protein [Dehalococcoidia bacterium]
MIRTVRTLFSPERRILSLVIAILLVSMFTAFGTGFWLLFRLVYIIAIAVPLAWLLVWWNTRDIDADVDRKTSRAQVGQDAQEIIEVRNRSFLPKVWLEVEDPSDLPGHRSKRVVIIPPRRSRNWIVNTPLRRRGLFDWGPLRVTASDPFGLFRRVRLVGGQQQILVYPPVVDLPHFQAPPANLPGEGRFRRRTHYVTPNASGVREYAPGDAFNRIHWKSTARTGEMMVKTFELDPASDIWIVIDLEKRVNAGREDDSTEEYGVRIAASIARHYVVGNRPVGLMTFGRDLSVLEPERGQQQLTRILESLATANAVGDAPLGNLLMEEQRRFGRHTTLVVITSSTDDSWLTAVQSLTQRGVRAAVVLIDPSTFGDTRSPLLLFGQLTASDILTYVVRRGDDLGLALSPTSSGVNAWRA